MITRGMHSLCSLAFLLLSSQLYAADYVTLEKGVNTRLATLEKLIKKAEQKKVDTSYERVAVTTAKVFKKVAAYDKAHPEDVEKAVKSIFFFKGKADEYLESFAERELQEVSILLDEAIVDLQSVINNPSSRRASIPIDLMKVKLKDGYLYHEEHPVFNFGLTWWKRDILDGGEKECTEAFGSTYAASWSPGFLGRNMKIKPWQLAKFKSLNGSDRVGTFISHKPAKWFVKANPDIENGKTHFVHYDIDNPKAIEMLQSSIDQIYSVAGPTKMPQMGHMIANEPHWFTGEGQWAAVTPSEYTFKKFRTWLKDKHTSISTLNSLWGSSFASFDDVELQVPIADYLQGSPQYYDWCRFNMTRVTDWFSMIKAGIRKHDPNGKVHIKLIPRFFSEVSRTHGLDFEKLCDLQGILGCDAKIISNSDTTSKMYKKRMAHWVDRYSVSWRDMITYDFFKSMYPEKLIFDSEFHAFSTSHWRDLKMGKSYVRMALWLAHMHGMGQNQSWYWGRDSSGKPKKGDQRGFLGSFSHRPAALNAYGLTMKELNAFSNEVVAFNKANRPVRIFYSETSAVNDGDYMNRVYGLYKVLYHQGLFLGFETAASINRKGNKAVADNSVLISPGNTQVLAEDRQAIVSFLEAGGSLITIGEDNFSQNEYGQAYPEIIHTGKETIFSTSDLDNVDLYKLLEQLLADKNLQSEIACKEVNKGVGPGCMWRVVKYNGKTLVFVVNLGNSDAHLTLSHKQGEILKPIDFIKNKAVSLSFDLKPYEIRLLQL